MADAASIIDTIAEVMREQKLTTIEQTMVRSLMLRMRPFDGYHDFAGMFRNRQHADRLYPLLQAYSLECAEASPDVQASLDVAVKTAMNEVRKT